MLDKIKDFVVKNYKAIIFTICLVLFMALAEDVFMKDIMKGDIIGYDLVSKYLISDFMTAVKERIIGAVSIMSDKDANIFWHIIQKHFKLPDTFADIEKVEPDETDLIMLKEIENNPDCHEFISQEELMKELNM